MIRLSGNYMNDIITRNIKAQQRERVFKYLKRDPQSLADFSQVLYKHICKHVGKRKITAFEVTYNLSYRRLIISGDWIDPYESLKLVMAMKQLSTICTSVRTDTSYAGFTVYTDYVTYDYPEMFADLEKMQVWGQLVGTNLYTVKVLERK